MDYSWIDDAIAVMPGTTVTFKPEWDSTLYHLQGKSMGMRGNYKDGRPILTIKLPPDQGEMLRETHESIIPGYYSNKTHYNSVFLDAGLPREFIIELLEDAWNCVFASLPKKTQTALAAEMPAQS
jgi:predicted DNA-binding protein (MmcQ/YjbR family)